MDRCPQVCWFSLFILAFNIYCSLAILKNGNKIKSATFLSPKFVLGPGLVKNRFYYNINFPRGHIALKSFNAEVVDDAGNSIPLHETYLHHWIVGKYYQCKNVTTSENNNTQGFRRSDHIFARNSGICQRNVLGQYFGLGSETRRTATHVPDPYGIEVGNPSEIPAGYEERWMLNVHAIDTRGVEDKLGRTECRCDLYNTTLDEYNRPLSPGYKGGLFCCYDQTQCKVIHGFKGVKRTLYLRYTVKWLDWDSNVLPVKIFIFDVTDAGKRLNGSGELSPESGCQIEYEVEPCNLTYLGSEGCVDVTSTSLGMPTGGYVVYAVAHQHTGGIGATLYGEDGRVLCTSIPIYGEGNEAGDEDGYIVGMTTCYPKPGSVKITDRENLVLESNYSRTTMHTGVMGIFYILVAEKLPSSTSFLDTSIQMPENVKSVVYTGGMVVLLGLAIITIGVGMYSWLKKPREDGYQPVRT